MKKWNRIGWLKWFSDSETRFSDFLCFSLLWFGVTMNSRCLTKTPRHLGLRRKDWLALPDTEDGLAFNKFQMALSNFETSSNMRKKTRTQRKTRGVLRCFKSFRSIQIAFYVFPLMQARVTELESLLVERVPLRRRPVAILEDRTLGMSWNLTLELWNKLNKPQW